MDAIALLPPIHVETFGQGRVRDGAILTGKGDVHPWLVANRQYDAKAPGGRSLTGFTEIPVGTDAGAAQLIVARLFETRPHPASMWFDGSRPHPEMPDPQPPVLRNVDGLGAGDAALEEVEGFGGRVLRLRSKSGTAQIIEIPGTDEGDLVVTAPAGSLACLMRPDGRQRPFWTVLPELGLVGAYWLYAADCQFSPMACLVRRIMDDRPSGPVPANEAIVVAHAAVTMAYLGDDYRAAAASFTDRCEGSDLDVDVLRWSFLADTAEWDTYERWTGEIAERVLREPVTHVASLKLAFSRMGSVAGILSNHGSPVADVARRAGLSLRGTATRTHWDHPLLTTASKPEPY